MALDRLAVVEGETVLEIGFGTGQCLRQIAELVGPTGRVGGVDISPEMLEKTRKRLDGAGLENRAELYCGDATSLPFNEATFDAVFLSFTLEVLDTPEIPVALAEINKVLKPGGRLGIVDMSKENGKSVFVRVYEWLHKRCPRYVGSRPIYAGQCLIDAGYQIKSKERIRIYRLPAEIIVATKSMPGNTVLHDEPMGQAS